MSYRADLTATPIPHKTSAWITCTLRDNDTTAIPPASLTTLTMTVYAPDYVPTSPTTDIVNSRNAQNVLNANNCTLSTAGVFEWALQPTDTVLLSTGHAERHVALLEWVGPDVGTGKHEFVFLVTRLEKVA